MMIKDKRIGYLFWGLIGFSFIFRCWAAMAVELGNDEVYYITYAEYPDLSHFDHPPFIGWLIQFTTFNLSYFSELLVRFGPVLLGTFNLVLIFLSGKILKDERTGLIAAFMLFASPYGSIISGTFAMPDAPQNTFWLLGLLAFLYAFNDSTEGKAKPIYLFLGFIATGLATLSKYTGIFVGLSAGLAILTFYNNWLKIKEFWLGIVSIVLICSPILFWNIENHFISFAFHGERVEIEDKGINLLFFFRELLGQVAYNNPLNIAAIVIAAIGWRRLSPLDSKYTWFLLYAGLPLIFTFLAFSLFRQTLPHWSGPGYHALILLAASWWSIKVSDYIPKLVWASVAVMIILVPLAIIQINYGLFPLDKEGVSSRRVGKQDFSLDMYGWRQLSQKISPIIKQDTLLNRMPVDAPFFSYRWFPAANIDYYVAHPLNRNLYAFGSLDKIHKYFWINFLRGLPADGTDGYYITSSRDMHQPYELYQACFDSIAPPDSIAIERGGKVAYYFFIYRMYNLDRKKLPGLPVGSDGSIQK